MSARVAIVCGNKLCRKPLADERVLNGSEYCDDRCRLRAKNHRQTDRAKMPNRCTANVKSGERCRIGCEGERCWRHA